MNNDDYLRKKTTSQHMDRRNFLKYSGIGASLPFVAGCSGDEGNGGNGGNGNTVGDFQDETITFGVLAPQPEEHVYGRSIANAAKLAVDQLNENGGILGADVEMLVGDTAFQPAQGRREHQRLTVEENVDVTIGPMFSSTLLGMFESIAEQETLAFSAGAATARVNELVKDDYERFKYWFRSSLFNTGVQLVDIKLEVLRQMAPELGWETVAMVNEDQVSLEAYHDRLAEKLPEYFDVPYVEQVVGVTNWTPTFDEVEDVGADLLFTTQIVIGRSMHKQWADQQRNFELGGTTIFSMLPSYYEDLNGAPRYSWSMNFQTPNSTNTEYTQPYMEAMFERFDEYPTYGGSCAYDGINMYAKAVSETGSLDEEVLIPYLEEDMVFEESTMMKKVDFQGPDEEFPHDPVYTTMDEIGIPVFQQWQESGDGTGEQVLFYPESQKTGDYKKPHWLD